MHNHSSRFFCIIVLFAISLLFTSPVLAKKTKRPVAKKERPFYWVNKVPQRFKKIDELKHETYYSKVNKVNVGYVVLLPPKYNKKKNSQKRYPVIYYLHGSRPGNETRDLPLVSKIQKAMQSGEAPPMIYVFNNGGEVSHYDFPEKKSWGETTFIKELIPHIDKKYRTISQREGRGLEGFSQGGRATGRLMFKYPELFISAAPMGGGHQREKKIAETKGYENKNLYFSKWKTNTYDTARRYAKRKTKPSLNILVVVGDKGGNYQANLDWMKHLDSLKIRYSKIILKGVRHNGYIVYDRAGTKIMRFHAKNFGLLKKTNRK